MKGVVPLAKARDESLFGAKAVGLGDATRAGLPIPPGVALSGDTVEAVAAGNERADQGSDEGGVGAGERPAGRAFVGGRRGRRRRQLRRPAPHAAERAVDRRPGSGDPPGVVVGELRLGDHLPQARRPLHPPECRRGRAVAARSRERRRDVHAEPDQRRRRATHRGELGARRGRGRGARDPRPLPARQVRRPCSSGRPALKKVKIRTAARRRHRRGGRRSRAGRVVVHRRRPARAALRHGHALRRGLRPGARHRVGVRRRSALPAPVPRGDHLGAVDERPRWCRCPRARPR